MNGFIELGVDTTIAAIAVFIALISLIFTAYQASLSRKHNQLSVKPQLATWATENTEKEFSAKGSQHANCVFQFEVMNNGIGPAIIRDYSVFFDGKKIGDNKNKPVLEKAIHEILDSSTKNFGRDVGIIGKDFPLRAGERITLLKTRTPIDLRFDSSAYRDFMDRFDAEFEYECIYGNKHFYTTKHERSLSPSA